MTRMSTEILPALAITRLRAQLSAAPDRDRPCILAAQQIAADHLRALGVKLGLRLTSRDIVALRALAEDAVRAAGLDLSDPDADVLASAGHAMRAAAAGYVADRTADVPRAGENRPTASDWQTLVAEHWRQLPIMRPREIDALVAARRRRTALDRPLASAA